MLAAVDVGGDDREVANEVYCVVASFNALSMPEIVSREGRRLMRSSAKGWQDMVQPLSSTRSSLVPRRDLRGRLRSALATRGEGPFHLALPMRARPRLE